MKLEEISQRYQVPLEKLNRLAKEGYFEGIKKMEDIEQLSCILTLEKIGFSSAQVQHYLKTANKAERRLCLYKQRDRILDQLHHAQACLSCIDFLVYELEES